MEFGEFRFMAHWPDPQPSNIAILGSARDYLIGVWLLFLSREDSTPTTQKSDVLQAFQPYT